jgi:hypothetical protein
MKSSYLKSLISALFVFTFFLKGNTKNLAISNTSITDSSEIKDTVVYVYVASIRKDIKGVLLFVDFIQYYSNEEAVAKAKERGDADTLYKNGKMLISIPGDYYIVNESKKVRKFYLSNKIKYSLQLNQDRQHPISVNSLDSFIKIYKDSPFKLHISGNEIIKVDEVILP